jgi:hypothetical protein
MEGNKPTWANVDTDSGLLPLSEAGVTVEAWGGVVAHPADSKIHLKGLCHLTTGLFREYLCSGALGKLYSRRRNSRKNKLE